MYSPPPQLFSVYNYLFGDGILETLKIPLLLLLLSNNCQVWQVSNSQVLLLWQVSKSEHDFD